MSKNLEKKVQDSLSSLIKKNQINDEVFAVGVSGGADSLALIYLLILWAEKNKKKLVALTVNHGLREEAKEEAEYVAKLMSKAGIEHHILNWKGSKPKTGIEEAARIARYSLIEEFCKNNNIKHLMVAHHKMDQAETFLMRLQRGSGLDGLSSMSEVSSLGSLQIIRPLLDITPNELKSYLKENNVDWREDISNYDEDFLRVKIRKLIPYLDEKIGLSADRIANTAKVLGRTKDYVEKQVQNFIKNNVKFLDKNVAKISIALLKNQHDEIIFRVVSTLLKDVAEKSYIPRAADVQRLCDAVLEEGTDLKNRTLGGCEIINYQGNLWIIPEIKNDLIVSKKEWEEFLNKNNKYRKLRLPHKVRKYIYISK